MHPAATVIVAANMVAVASAATRSASGSLTTRSSTRSSEPQASAQAKSNQEGKAVYEKRENGFDPFQSSLLCVRSDGRGDEGSHATNAPK